jgi:hypothetical protein
MLGFHTKSALRIAYSLIFGIKDFILAISKKKGSRRSGSSKLLAAISRLGS